MAMIRILQELSTGLFETAYNQESFIRTLATRKHTGNHQVLNTVPIMVKGNTRFWD